MYAWAKRRTSPAVDPSDPPPARNDGAFKGAFNASHNSNIHSNSGVGVAPSQDRRARRPRVATGAGRSNPPLARHRKVSEDGDPTQAAVACDRFAVAEKIARLGMFHPDSADRV